MMVHTVTSSRLDQLRAHFAEWEVDGVLITSPANRRWLSGFSGSAAQLLITGEQAIISTDFRYWEQAQLQAPAFSLFQHRRRADDTRDFLAKGGVKRIGIEAPNMSVAEYEELKGLDGYQWKPLATTVEWLRQIKSAEELETMRQAAAIGDQAMAQVHTLARPGISEKALAWKLEQLIREQGAESVAFSVIVSSGPNSAYPHHHPGERELQPGDVFMVDLGAQVRGYKSDLTRSFHLGSEPDHQFWLIYNTVLAAQTAALENIRPGMTWKEADALARDPITTAGYGDQFGHGLGHGVGLDIHEMPRLSRVSEKEILAEGATTTIEPGIYVPGWGGVRIEDLVLVTAAGASPLSQCAKTPVIAVVVA